MAVFTTILSSANFALNCAEGDAAALARLFDGMSEEQARRVLAAPGLVAVGPGRNQITVPDRIAAPA